MMITGGWLREDAIDWPKKAFLGLRMSVSLVHDHGEGVLTLFRKVWGILVSKDLLIQYMLPMLYEQLPYGATFDF